MYTRYLLIYGIGVSLLSTPFVLSYLYLSHMGEYLPLKEIQEIQANSAQSLYGTAVHSDIYFYKLEGYRQQLPNIVAVGSSRIMQLRQQFFTTTFYNAGGMISSLYLAEHAINQLLEIHEPKVLIISVDFWWFLNEQIASISLKEAPKEKSRRYLASVRLPFLWLMHKKITLHNFLTTILHERNKKHIIGVSANTQNSGFGSDGSQYYQYNFTAGTQIPIEKMYTPKAQTLAMSTTGYFQMNQTIDRNRIDKFAALITKIRSKNIIPIILVPPLPEAFTNAMNAQKKGFQYYEEIFSTLAKKGVPLYTFQNLQGISDCEFIDEIHPDHVASARMLLSISAEENSPIKQYVNTAELLQLTQESDNVVACDTVLNTAMKRYFTD